MTSPAQFRDQLVTYFNLEEFKDLCFFLNIPYDHLPGEALPAKARELIGFCIRHGRFSLLVEQCQRLRPQVEWAKRLEERSPSLLKGKTAVFPSVLQQAPFEYKISLVRDSIQQLHQEHAHQRAIPLPLLHAELRALFNRNTFADSIHSCRDQNWHDRFCAAVQTDYFLLGCWGMLKAGAKQDNDPQALESFEIVQRALRNYSQSLTALFSKPFTVAMVNRYFLDNKTDQIRQQLREARLFREGGLSSDTIDHCEQYRQEINEVVNEWPIF